MLQTQQVAERPTAPAKVTLFRNILVATDFSPVSQRALGYAVSLARRFHSRIYVTHIVTPESSQMMVPELARATHDSLMYEADQALKKILNTGVLADIPYELVVEEGALWPAVESLATKLGIDLIVVGTHGMGMVKKLLMGSGAEQIFRQASRPVLTVGPVIEGEKLASAAIENILFATDFGLGAEREAQYALWIAEELGAKLTFLNVATHAEDYGEETVTNLRLSITHQLKELVPAENRLKFPPEFRVTIGKPVEDILQTAGEVNAGLIVMGAKKNTGLVGHLPQIKAYRVVCSAHCPVLTIRS